MKKFILSLTLLLTLPSFAATTLVCQIAANSSKTEVKSFKLDKKDAFKDLGSYTRGNITVETYVGYRIKDAGQVEVSVFAQGPNAESSAVGESSVVLNFHAVEDGGLDNAISIVCSVK